MAALPWLLENAAWLMPLLLAGGLSPGADSKKSPGVSSDSLKSHFENLKSKHSGDERKAIEEFLATHGPDRIKAAYEHRAPAPKPSKGAAIKGGLGKAFHYGTTGLFALGTLPLLMDMFRGQGGGGEEDMAALMGGPPTGGGEGGLDEMLMQAMDQDRRVQLRGMEAESRGAANMANRRGFSSTPVSNAGFADDLETLIRGHERELGSIAHQEPLSLAQAFAMKGLYRPEEPTRFDFRNLM
jgi:hypothetical protein